MRNKKTNFLIALAKAIAKLFEGLGRSIPNNGKSGKYR